jgi:hypothetical protein
MDAIVKSVPESDSALAEYLLTHRHSGRLSLILRIKSFIKNRRHDDQSDAYPMGYECATIFLCQSENKGNY